MTEYDDDDDDEEEEEEEEEVGIEFTDSVNASRCPLLAAARGSQSSTFSKFSLSAAHLGARVACVQINYSQPFSSKQ
ncbi:hypothetical protein SprV_0802578400 [Sparganum proliferum]